VIDAHFNGDRSGTVDTLTPEIESLKARLKSTWMSGDYGHFAKYLEPGALEFFQRLEITPGIRVLDVACGAGPTGLDGCPCGGRCERRRYRCELD
jgi:hypothetical protein